MKRMVAGLVLVILTAVVGCIEGPKMKKGGGESVVLELVNGRPTGRIDVRGHVVNEGSSTAWNVVLTFKFSDDGVPIFEEIIRIGDVAGGDSADFNGAFYGPPVKGVFTWEYRIDWD